MIPYGERKNKKEARQFQYSHCWLMFTVKEGLVDATLALHEYLEYG